MRLMLACVALWLGACGDAATTLLVTIDGPAAVTSLEVTVALTGGTSVTRTLPLGAASLPARAIVELPDVVTQVTLDVTGHASGGVTLQAHAVVQSQPHHQLTVPLALGPAPTDGAANVDLGVDLAASVDLGVVDLSPLADLTAARADLTGVTLPVARLVSNAWYSDWSGTTYRSSPGMSRSGYQVDAYGVVDGDLLLFVASIDNGSNTVWPNPVAPGFTQLAQEFYGNDGETYVVAWKVANNEPVTYTNTFGPGVNSGSSAISLIAISGAAAATPINTYIAGHTPGAGTSPVVGASAGVTTTLGNCLIVYASGADWECSPGNNSFTPPAGFTPLAQIGDRGGANWDWTSQQIAYVTQASAGPTGAVSGSLNSACVGTAWTVVVAVALK